MTPHITNHAIDRYRQRVENVTEDEVRRRLDTPAIRLACDLGAEHVILPTGQRVFIRNGSIITIRPKPPRKRCRSGRVQGRQGAE